MKVVFNWKYYYAYFLWSHKCIANWSQNVRKWCHSLVIWGWWCSLVWLYFRTSCYHQWLCVDWNWWCNLIVRSWFVDWWHCELHNKIICVDWKRVSVLYILKFWDLTSKKGCCNILFGDVVFGVSLWVYQKLLNV